MSEDIDNIRRVLPIMNQISPTFCMAKYHHTQLYLQTGQTHSCYHPAPHAIPLEGLDENPAGLHNTPQKKFERKQMWGGGKPRGCQYCWNIEGLGPEYVSDRHIRNASIYTPQRFAEIQENGYEMNVNPQYIEISFSNVCNFKCGYCNPNASSPYQAEIEKYGPVLTVKNHRLDPAGIIILKEEDNPYVEAWWKWWDEMKNDLTILRITGGEPLLHRSTWKVFDKLKEEPLPNLELNINSNLGSKRELVQKLVDNVNTVVHEGYVKKFKLFTSIDTWGPKAEYLRTGMNLELWEKNLELYVTETHSPVTLMITFNILSVTSFKELLKKILEWRKKWSHLVYDNSPYDRKIRFDTPYLKEPLQYDMNILPKEEFMPYMDEALQFMKDNVDEKDVTKFSELEYEKFRRVVDYMRTAKYRDDVILEGRNDFWNWFDEYDRRRGTNFLETFPEYKNFYEMCKNNA